VKIGWRQIRKHLESGIKAGLLLAILSASASAQMDQGTITGVVQDTTGAVISGATVVLTSTDTGLKLVTKADSSGIYTFPSSRIGNYNLSATYTGFQTTVQEKVHLDVQQRLNVVLVLKPGTITDTVTVTTAPPLLQTQEGSTGQVMSSETINNTPLNGRNWVYIVQTAAGITPSTGSPAMGTGDFSANGQRVEQNDSILDGFDNNNGSFNFGGGSSIALQPPPDALAEFKVQTADFSAEFGHSAGAVVNTSIKAGTNYLHGDIWEYVRNNVFDARDWNSLTVPEYRENQFGATLGLPVIKNKLFAFGYAEANRIVYGNTTTSSVPTALMRQGNFSELLNPALTSSGIATPLYQPGSAGTVALSCNGVANVICQPNPIAQNILSLYPMPNTNGGKLYSNYVTNTPDVVNSWEFGTRFDWNISTKDQSFARYSYSNEDLRYPPVFGLPLDGGSGGTDGVYRFINEGFAFSETHLFSTSLTNEARYGFNYGKYLQLQFDSDTNVSANLGFGGIPYSPGFGGLPHVTLTGISLFGSPAANAPNNSFSDNYQISDTVTKIFRNHSFRMGIFLQSLRAFTTNSNPRGSYTFNGYYTSIPGKANTGFGPADFLLDQMDSASVSTVNIFRDSRWYRAGFMQDDWRPSRQLNINMGLRYDFYQPSKEVSGRQASFNAVPGTLGPGTGQATLTYVTQQQQNLGLAPAFLTILSQNNVAVQYSGNPALTTAQHANFAPRVGFAYTIQKLWVLRGGFGLFYGGLESDGPENFLANYPFQFSSSFSQPTSCKPGACPSDGLTLETGFQQQINGGFNNYVSQPVLYGVQPNTKSPYSENFNLTVERALGSNMIVSAAYVGALDRHLQVPGATNSPDALIDPRLSSNTVKPFPTLGAATLNSYAAVSSYNSLQTKVEKRLTNGMNFLATYTWAHALDDAVDDWTTYGPDTGYRAYNLIGIGNDYSNSAQDIRHRVTFNGYYELPFGAGKKLLSHRGIVDTLAGGWATDILFSAQTGPPITISTNLGSSGPNGGTAEAIRVRNPFAAGGSPDPSNPAITCATATHTLQHWYNPCAFANPPLAFPQAAVAGSPVSTTQILGLNALPYLGGRRLSGATAPGYERINMSLFKTFHIFREISLQFRADAFNVLNTPSYGRPSISSDAATGGQITAPQTFQNFTPDARFFQLSGKLSF
jgi:hypothetical protein